MSQAIRYIDRISAVQMRRLLFFFWFLLNLLQAFFTEIHADEAYYVLYGSHLAWGYYDHPPMVALLVWLSSKLWSFGGCLSVRLMTVLLHTATVFLIYKTTDLENDNKKGLLWFFLTGMSMTMFCVYGFMTTPDVPLLFFTALFFYVYKRYLQSNNSGAQWLYALLIGLSVGCMMLSKYMGVLIVIFTILSNLSLVADKKMWVALLIGIGLFIPHLCWQYANDFPSFSYHLVGRSTGMNFLYFVEYLPNQLLVFNPLVFCLMLYAAWRQRFTHDYFTRSLSWCIIGFIVFFLFSSFRGHVEPHWTVAASVPALLLLTKWYVQSDLTLKNESLLWKLSALMFAIVLIARIVLALNVLPERFGLSGKRERYDKMHEVCGDKPLVFAGSFQDPSLYMYFEGGQATVLSELHSRRTQYDILAAEHTMQGQPVCVMAQVHDAKCYEYQSGSFYCYNAKALQAANRIGVEIAEVTTQGDSLYLKVQMSNSYDVDFDFDHEEFPISVFIVGQADGIILPSKCTVVGPKIIPARRDETYYLACKCAEWDKKNNEIELVVCLRNSWITSQNSKPFKIIG